jgi:hypothetical protein
MTIHENGLFVEPGQGRSYYFGQDLYTFLHSPKGQLHRFTNTTATPAKVMIWVTPAGFEHFIAEVGKTIMDRLRLERR